MQVERHQLLMHREAVAEVVGLVEMEMQQTGEGAQEEQEQPAP
jgi:hypothetical protein